LEGGNGVEVGFKKEKRAFWGGISDVFLKREKHGIWQIKRGSLCKGEGRGERPTEGRKLKRREFPATCHQCLLSKIGKEKLQERGGPRSEPQFRRDRNGWEVRAGKTLKKEFRRLKGGGYGTVKGGEGGKGRGSHIIKESVLGRSQEREKGRADLEIIGTRKKVLEKLAATKKVGLHMGNAA